MDIIRNKDTLQKLRDNRTFSVLKKFDNHIAKQQQIPGRKGNKQIDASITIQCFVRCYLAKRVYTNLLYEAFLKTQKDLDKRQARHVHEGLIMNELDEVKRKLDDQNLIKKHNQVRRDYSAAMIQKLFRKHSLQSIERKQAEEEQKPNPKTEESTETKPTRRKRRSLANINTAPELTVAINKLEEVNRNLQATSPIKSHLKSRKNRTDLKINTEDIPFNFGMSGPGQLGFSPTSPTSSAPCSPTFPMSPMNMSPSHRMVASPPNSPRHSPSNSPSISPSLGLKNIPVLSANMLLPSPARAKLKGISIDTKKSSDDDLLPNPPQLSPPLSPDCTIRMIDQRYVIAHLEDLIDQANKHLLKSLKHRDALKADSAHLRIVIQQLTELIGTTSPSKHQSNLFRKLSSTDTFQRKASVNTEPSTPQSALSMLGRSIRKSFGVVSETSPSSTASSYRRKFFDDIQDVLKQ